MKYYIVAGEASGDLHASGLIGALRKRDPEADIRAWGGEKMLAAGAQLVHDYRGADVMGLTDAIGKGSSLLQMLSSCKKDILSFAPDALVLVDYPGFNMRLAKFAHAHGIRVIYYIAPKTWASRSYRNRALRRYVDRLLIVFPFEKEYFTAHKVPYVYVGNPLVEATESYTPRSVSEEPYVALLAGSRKGEISRMMPVCMELADKLDCKMVIAGAPGRTEQDYLPFICGRKNVELVFGRTYDVLAGASAAVVNSGTASLEAALLGTPQVVCWSTSAVTAWIARHILHVMDHIRYISLANLILDKPVFKELVQEDFTVQNVYSDLLRLMNDNAAREQMKKDYNAVAQALGGTGASDRAAEEIIKEIKHIQNS